MFLAKAKRRQRAFLISIASLEAIRPGSLCRLFKRESGRGCAKDPSNGGLNAN